MVKLSGIRLFRATQGARCCRSAAWPLYLLWVFKRRKAEAWRGSRSKIATATRWEIKMSVTPRPGVIDDRVGRLFTRPRDLVGNRWMAIYPGVDRVAIWHVIESVGRGVLP